jgi:hypothetical protein
MTLSRGPTLWIFGLVSVGGCMGGQRLDVATDVKAIGDPAPGCAKDYVAEWSCGGSSTVRSSTVAAEAGFGSVVSLVCP